MKLNRNPKRIRRLAAVLGGFALFTGTLPAAPFLYSSGDLTLAVRKSGNAFDYVVNLGKATNYNNLPGSVTFTVTNLSATQLGSAFPDLNDLQWSVAAANRPPDDPNYPVQTLWVTRPRAVADTQSPPWVRKGQFTQATAGAQIDAVGVNSATYSSGATSNVDNTVTGVVIPVSTDYKLAPVIGDDGNYVGTFQGKVEAVTPSDFDGDPGNVSRADLYELEPATSTLGLPGRYLGYFELKPNGVLTFNSASTLPARPTITGITRVGNVTTVSFTTVTGVNYRLRATDAAGLSTPVATWSIGSSVVGTGSVLSLTDTSTADLRFFAVDAQ
ncbi:MAG TPA: hypothetical protein VFZ59_26675 [Verrucomicrobiae bacterium]|nr:hypothetical protein [Verrucomicrobiae bacterium]